MEKVTRERRGGTTVRTGLATRACVNADDHPAAYPQRERTPCTKRNSRARRGTPQRAPAASSQRPELHTNKASPQARVRCRREPQGCGLRAKKAARKGPGSACGRAFMRRGLGAKEVAPGDGIVVRRASGAVANGCGRECDVDRRWGVAAQSGRVQRPVTAAGTGGRRPGAGGNRWARERQARCPGPDRAVLRVNCGGPPVRQRNGSGQPMEGERSDG